MIIPRALDYDQIRLLKDGQDVTISETDPFFDQFPTHNVIRIQEEEFEALPEAGKLFTHFNLQVSNHKVGQIYLLPKIVDPGYFDGEHEVLPLLSFDHVPYGECIEVKEEVRYEDLTEGDFEHSFSHIKNTDELRTFIFKRYAKSMPHLSQEQMLGLGVSKTTLKILGRV